MLAGWVVGSLGVRIGEVVVPLANGAGCAETKVTMIARRLVVMLGYSILGGSVT